MFHRLALNLLTVLVILAGSVSARADLQFPQPVADAGVIYAGTPLVHEFTFENRGPETIVLTEARASCGCLKPRFTQSQYEPGQKGALTLEVNTLSQAPGPHTWTVRLKYQTGSVAREMAFQLNARLIAEVTVQPAVLIVFADKIGRHELVLTDSRAQRWRCWRRVPARPSSFPASANQHMMHKVLIARSAWRWRRTTLTAGTRKLSISTRTIRATPTFAYRSRLSSMRSSVSPPRRAKWS